MRTRIISQILDSTKIHESEKRDYIGASLIGSDCYRKIWYEYNKYEGDTLTNKTLRTFEIGKAVENKIKYWMIKSGFCFAETEPLKDSELTYFQGNVDGIWLKKDGDMAIIEIKTANSSSFNQFVKNGLIQWNSAYYDQVQAYMGMSGIHEAYVIVFNKDNSELHDERVDFNEERYEELKEKAKFIHDSEIPPPKISGNPAWYACKMCKFHKQCHG